MTIIEVSYLLNLRDVEIVGAIIFQTQIFLPIVCLSNNLGKHGSRWRRARSRDAITTRTRVTQLSAMLDRLTAPFPTVICVKLRESLQR